MAGPLLGGRGETRVSRSQASVPRARRPASPPWARAGPQVGMWPRQGEARDVVFGSLTFVTLRRGGAQDSGLHAGRAQAARGRCGCAGVWAARRWGALCAGARRAQHWAPRPRSLARRGRCCPRGGPGRPRPRCVWFAAARGGGRTSAVQRRDAEAEPQVCSRPAGRNAGVARGALAAERPGNRGFPPCSLGVSCCAEWSWRGHWPRPRESALPAPQPVRFSRFCFSVSRLVTGLQSRLKTAC